MADTDDAARTATEEILALEARIYSDPSSRHDIDHLLAPDFWEVSASGEKTSRDELLQRLAANPMIVDSYPIDDTRVDVYGDVAISTGHATLHGRLPLAEGGEKPIVRTSRFVHVWVRTNDVWQTVFAQASPSAED